MNSLRLLIFAQAILPYLLHNAAYMALPSGLTYHFRYRKKRFHDSVVQSDEWGADLKGKTGLLVLRDWERATFMPLRKFQIHDIQDFGEFVFVDLEFLNYVVYPTLGRSNGDNALPHTHQQEREQYHDKIAELIPNDVNNNHKQHMSSLIVGTQKPIAKIVELDEESDLHTTLLHWCRIVHLLGTLPGLQGVSFYRVAKLAATNHPSAPLTPITLSDGRKGYRLTAGTTYSLRLLQSIPHSIETVGLPFDMELQSNEQHIEPMRKTETVDGPYDALTFHFNTVPQATSKVKSFLVIESKQRIKFSKSSGAWQKGTFKKRASMPVNFIPVEIKWSWWTLVWRQVLPPLAVLLAVLLWSTSEYLVTTIAFLQSLGVTAEILRYAAVFLLGFAFQNWSAFTGQFRVKSQSIP